MNYMPQSNGGAESFHAPATQHADRNVVPLMCREELVCVATAMIAHRRRRYDHFDKRLFADPAWDILLAMTVAECSQQRVTISQLCDRIDAPMTTALRWVASMTDDGLLIRQDDFTDKRRKFIKLSSEALSEMIRYCSARDTPRALAA
jgi:DNA-binding MarR family transcriptional regulator